jgi:hypothetical protein
MADPISTEFKFTLPIGYVGPDGTLNKDGVMRLATAADEIMTMRDARVQANAAYHPIVVLARVVTQLGSLDIITPDVIGNLFVADFDFLIRLYEEKNGGDDESNEQAARGRLQEVAQGNVDSLPLRANFMRR